jgi:N-methylhydantoinase B
MEGADHVQRRAPLIAEQLSAEWASFETMPGGQGKMVLWRPSYRPRRSSFPLRRLRSPPTGRPIPISALRPNVPRISAFPRESPVGPGYPRLYRYAQRGSQPHCGLSGEIAITLGGIESAKALVMTHGAEVPNSSGLAGGWPGATVRQTLGRNAVQDGCRRPGEWQTFGPKPGFMIITNRDVFAVSWQGGGGWGDPLERDVEAVSRDVAAKAVSPEAAKEIYGVVLKEGRVDVGASEQERLRIRQQRSGQFVKDPAKFVKGGVFGAISESLFLARDKGGIHVVTRAGYILSTDHTGWRSGAAAVSFDRLPREHGIVLHEGLSITAYYCPATGTLLSVDIHERDTQPVDDVVLDLWSAERILGESSSRLGEVSAAAVKVRTPHLP